MGVDGRHRGEDRGEDVKVPGEEGEAGFACVGLEGCIVEDSLGERRVCGHE